MIPKVTISSDMLAYVNTLRSQCEINRTKTSPYDVEIGILGELCFAQYYYGSWRHNNVVRNAHKVDFPELGVEVKCSWFVMDIDRLHLVVREDYAKSRKPAAYIQVIIDKRSDSISVGDQAYICGYATSAEVDAADKHDKGSKFGKSGGYLSHCIPLRSLHPISELDAWLQTHRNGS